MAHVVVIGAGGVGGYFAALLAEHGHQVTVMARGDTCTAINTSGLRIQEPSREPRVITTLRAVNSLKNVSAADVVLVCVKSWQVAAAAVVARPVVADHTVVIPVQNGVDAADRLTGALDQSNVVDGVCTVFSSRTTATQIERIGEPATLRIGSTVAGAPNIRRIKNVASMLTLTGITTTVAVDIRRDSWRKLMFIASFGGVAALANATAGVIRDQPRTLALYRSAVHEVAEVARAAAVPITESDVETTLARLHACEALATASMMRDIADGRPSELYDQTGAVVHYGEQLDVPTPTHSVVYGALLPRELAARGENSEPAWVPPTSLVRRRQHQQPLNNLATRTPA